MEIIDQPATMKGPADWFTGDVYVDAIAQAQSPAAVLIVAVHFTPCAHTAR